MLTLNALYLYTTSALDVNCPALPTWDGMVVSASNNHYQTAVNVSCVEGMMFPDRTANKSAICNEYGEWEPPIEDCIGKLICCMPAVWRV